MAAGKSDVMDIVLKTLVGDGDPDTLRKALELAKTTQTSSAELQEKISGEGRFEFLDMASRATATKGLSTAKLLSNIQDDVVLKKFLVSPGTSRLPPEYVAALREKLHELRSVVEDDAESHMDQEIFLQFKDNFGSFCMFYLALCRGTTEGRWNYKFACADGTFAPAPDYLLVKRKKAKSNILKSKSEEYYEVTPLPGHLSAGTIDSLLKAIVPNVAACFALLDSPGNALAMG